MQNGASEECCKMEKMEMTKIKIDQTLLTCVAEVLGRIPETMYDFQKVKNLSCGGKPLTRRLIDPYHDPVPERIEIEEGNFSVIGKMSRLKKLTISAMPVRDFSFLKTALALETLEISGCGVIDCVLLENLKNLKTLSLQYCSELKNVESILKLFRLTRLSLEGSQFDRADCFMNCRIKEVHLPEHLLKAERAKERAKKTGSKGKKSGAKLFAGVPFKEMRWEKERYPYQLEAPDSWLWEEYRGAYGNVAKEVAVLMGEREEAPETGRLRRLETVSKTNYEITFDNLFENLYHQMSFYRAAWLVLPYLARLMEKWAEEGDLEWVFRGIMAAGSVLATDVYGDEPAEPALYESYQNAIRQIQAAAVNFLAKHLEYILEKKDHWRSEFAVAVTAVLGERKLAYLLYLSGMESCYVVCPACENCDEEMEIGYFDLAERIKAARVPAGKWDGESLEDAKLWLFNLFALLEDQRGFEYLCYLFGTYTCPECGEKSPVSAGMEAYYLGE